MTTEHRTGQSTPQAGDTVVVERVWEAEVVGQRWDSAKVYFQTEDEALAFARRRIDRAVVTGIDEARARGVEVERQNLLTPTVTVRPVARVRARSDA
jgi:hypothetical protein